MIESLIEGELKHGMGFTIYICKFVILFFVNHPIWKMVYPTGHCRCFRDTDFADCVYAQPFCVNIT